MRTAADKVDVASDRRRRENVPMAHSIILGSGYACGSQNTGNNLAEGLHKDEEQHGIDTQGYDTLHQTDGEKILPFHTVHEVQPQGIQGAGFYKLKKGSYKNTDRGHFGTVQDQTEGKAENRVAECEARKEGACLGGSKEADHIACDTGCHTHHRSAIGSGSSQRQEREAELQIGSKL